MVIIEVELSYNVAEVISMKKVALITTGGTIASKKNENNKLESGKMSGEEILKMCQLDDIEIILIDLFQLPSMHLDFSSLNELNKKVCEVLNQDDINGVVITHGTDSLEETAYFLELTTSSNKPIVVTGSQKSSEDIGTDVYSNLRDSILVATDSNSISLGVVVVFNQQIFHSKYVKKIHSSSINGFGAIGYGKLGYIDNDEVVIYQKPFIREYYEVKDSYPSVEIVYAYLGATGLILKALSNEKVNGIILIGGGRGQVTVPMKDVVPELIEKGIKVVLVSSTKEGRVYPTYDYEGSANNLNNMGVIMGGDYDAKKARIKLMLMIANNVDNYNMFA